MQPIRPLDRGDLPEVASLYEKVMRSGLPAAPPGLAEAFERIFLDGPLSDPEIPSLVYQEPGGPVVGFLGSHVRRMAFDGEPIRVAYSGQLVADESSRSKAVGALLMSAYMKGPQRATITDGANETVRRIWEMMGGEAALVSCIRWTRIFRPWRFTGDLLGRRAAVRPLMTICRPVFRALDGMLVRLPVGGYRRPAPPVSAEELSPAALVEWLPVLGRSFRLRPEYELPFLEWLWKEMAEVKSRGSLRGSLLRDPGGKVVGWHIYYLLPSGVSKVMQVAAAEGAMDSVLEHLMKDAEVSGSAALQGRVEHHLLEPLSRRGVILQYREPLMLVHSREPEVLRAIQSGKAMLSRMDGEWWLGTFDCVPAAQPGARRSE